MANIMISRYEVPTDAEREALQAQFPDKEVGYPSDRWESYIEPEDRSWILYVAQDGTPMFWSHRDENGGVIGEPTTR